MFSYCIKNCPDFAVLPYAEFNLTNRLISEPLICSFQREYANSHEISHINQKY